MAFVFARFHIYGILTDARGRDPCYQEIYDRMHDVLLPPILLVLYPSVFNRGLKMNIT